MYIFIVLCLFHHFAYKPHVETSLLIPHLLMPLSGFQMDDMDINPSLMQPNGGLRKPELL